MEMVTLPLLHVRGLGTASEPPGWEDWFKGAGLSGLPTLGGVVVGSLTLALEAARVGLGAALAPSHLAAGDIASGRLMVPHNFFMPAAQSHLLVYPQESKAKPVFRRFRTWLLSEVRSGA
jgi:DNA-binding transcriptional LysR family regulator